MENGRFRPGDLVRIQAGDEELQSFDDDKDGYVEAVVVQTEDQKGRIVAAVVSGGDQKLTGAMLHKAGNRFEMVPGIRFEAVAEKQIRARKKILDEVRSSLAAEAEQAQVEIDESTYTEIGNYIRHEKVNDLPDEELRAVGVGIAEKALQMARQDGRVGAGHIREAVLQLCYDPFGDCSGAAESILEGGDHESENQ